MDNDDLSRVCVYLCFSGYDGDPDDISLKVGLSPISVHKEGQYKTGRSIPFIRSFWSAKLIEARVRDVGGVVDRAVASFLDKSPEVLEISRKTSNESYIVVTVTLGSIMPSINISPNAIRAIGEMNLSLDIGLFQ